jgi:hypothetical protein
VQSQSRDRLEFAPPREKAMTGSNATSAKGWVLALTAAASFMIALDALAVTTALSAIRLDLGVSIEALEWTVNAYNLCVAALLLTGARAGRSLRAPAHVRPWPRDFRVGIGCVRACRKCRLADRPRTPVQGAGALCLRSAWSGRIGSFLPRFAML